MWFPFEQTGADWFWGENFPQVMTFASMMNGGAVPSNDEVSKLVNAANGINRFYSPYQFGSRNPYESSYDESSPHHYPNQPGYES